MAERNPRNPETCRKWQKKIVPTPANGERAGFALPGVQYTDYIETEELAYEALHHPYVGRSIAPHMHTWNFPHVQINQS